MKRDSFSIPGIQLPPEQPNLFDRVRRPAAIGFVAHLHRKYEQRRRDLMEARAERQAALDAGKATFGFLPETRAIREAAWTIAPVPPDLEDRRVEITGPVERKMVINALNSGASTFMADFEDSSKPTWDHVFTEAESRMNLPGGTIKATVLIETLPAAFEMDEILYELRDHSAGLNCGRWDYIFSCIKKLRRGNFVFADRAQVTMTAPFLRAYCQLLVKTCHRRNAHAMGGMAAQIPIKGDEVANDAAMAKVRADKEREAGDGFDGTWVAHPCLVAVAKHSFDRAMPDANQIHRKREDACVKAADLLAFGPAGPITEQGLRTNINVSLQYVGSWLAGQGCVPINHLMEDAATAEISRSQIWQWIRSPKGELADGRKVTVELFRRILEEELRKVSSAPRASRARYDEAAWLLDRLVASDEFADFLTDPAYDFFASLPAPQQEAVPA